MQKKQIGVDQPVSESIPAFWELEQWATTWQNWFFDADFLQQVAKTKHHQEHIDEFVQAKIAEFAMQNEIESDFPYFLSYFFDQWQHEEVDAEYVLKVGSSLLRYEAELIDKVNQYTQTFKYDQMDIMDQACLLLGYLEYKVVQTPREVIINEMVELAKRYSDDWAPKLINGILHPLLQAEQV